jgi:hypothetical protein
MKPFETFGDAQLYDVTSADAAVTPPSRGVVLATAGPLEAIMADSGRTVIIPALLAGVVYPFRIKQINAAGTTATSVCVLR